MLYHSYSPIKVALDERFIITIRFLALGYCKLINTATFIRYLDKIIQIYNHCPHRSPFNISHLEVHREGDDTLNIFLKQYSN